MVERDYESITRFLDVEVVAIYRTCRVMLKTDITLDVISNVYSSAL